VGRQKITSDYRFLTEDEHAHLMYIARRATLAAIAERVGMKFGRLTSSLNSNPVVHCKLREEEIARLMALKIDDFERMRLRRPGARVDKSKLYNSVLGREG